MNELGDSAIISSLDRGLRQETTGRYSGKSRRL